MIITYVPQTGYDSTQHGLINDGSGGQFDVGAALSAGSGVITVDTALTPHLTQALDSYPGVRRNSVAPGTAVTADVTGPPVFHTKNSAAGNLPVQNSDGSYSSQPKGQLGILIPAVFSFSGSLVAVVGAARFPVPVNGSIVSAIAAVGTAPTGAAVIADVKKNGTTVFTTQANRPTIAVSTNKSSSAVPDVTVVGVGDLISVDIAQAGTTVPGSDLTVVVLIQPS